MTTLLVLAYIYPDISFRAGCDDWDQQGSAKAQS